MRSNISSTGPLSIAFIDGFIFRFIQEFYLGEGEEGSGLGNFYAFRLNNHVGGLQDYEGSIFEYLVQQFKGNPWLVHVGIGIGSLPTLLAATGHEVIGVEGDRKRVRLARQLREAIRQIWPKVANLYNLIDEYYPAALNKLPPIPEGRTSVLIFTNFGTTRSDEEIDSVISTFTHFEHVILDLRTFCGTFESAPAREQLRARVLARGFEEVRPIHATPGSFYTHFKRQ